MVAENNLDLSALDGLSPEERELTLKILQQYATEGMSDIFTDLEYSDYEEIPVDIITFMHDRRYLGNALYNQEGKFTNRDSSASAGYLSVSTAKRQKER